MIKILKILKYPELIQALSDMTVEEYADIIRLSSQTADWPISRVKIAVLISSGISQNDIYNDLHVRMMDEPVAEWYYMVGGKEHPASYRYGKNAFKMYERDFRRYFRAAIRVNNAK